MRTILWLFSATQAVINEDLKPYSFFQDLWADNENFQFSHFQSSYNFQPFSHDHQTQELIIEKIIEKPVLMTYGICDNNLCSNKFAISCKVTARSSVGFQSLQWKVWDVLFRQRAGRHQLRGMAFWESSECGNFSTLTTWVNPIGLVLSTFWW